MRGNNILSRLLVLLLMFGAILTFMGVRDFVDDKKTPENYNSMVEADFQKGMIVEGDIYGNLGAFEENYTTTNGVKTGSSRYNYMIPVGEKQYMGLLNQTSTQEAELEAQADDSFAYLMGESSKEPQPVHFKGKVKVMDSETKGYLRDYMLDLGFTESEINSLILEYYIQCDDYSGWLWQIVVGLVCLGIGVAILVVPMISANRKNNVIFANSGPTNSSSVGSVVKDDFNTFQSGSNETDNNSFGNTTTFNNSYDNTAENTNTNSYSSESGLGMGVADGYKEEDEKPKSGLSLKLKDN